MRGLLLLILLANFLAVELHSQELIHHRDVEDFVIDFSISDGTLSGPGSVYLSQLATDNQYIMIGEYHGSRRISEFTEALLPTLDSAGFATMILEVGPSIGRLLDSLSPQRDTLGNQVRAILAKYTQYDEDGYPYLPFPFVETEADVDFLQKAIAQDWRIIGIDQEYIDGMILLHDYIWSTVSPPDTSTWITHYRSVRDTLRSYYALDMKGDEDFVDLWTTSRYIQSYYEQLPVDEIARQCVNDMRRSMEIYHLIGKRQYHDNNYQRSLLMKSQLARQVQRLGLDVFRDKMLIKMGGKHIQKGLTEHQVYDIANTLHELAAFAGNKTANIAFLSRYRYEDGAIVDVLSGDSEWAQELEPLLHFAKPDSWSLIPLRGLITPVHYYPKQYRLTSRIAHLVDSYDAVILVPVELPSDMLYVPKSHKGR